MRRLLIAVIVELGVAAMLVASGAVRVRLQVEPAPWVSAAPFWRDEPGTARLPDALALWQDAYFESLASRNYSEGTLEGRRDALKMFLAWAAERDLSQASQLTRPILESYQRWLWRYTKANGQRLGWSTQRNRLGILKDFFRWITRQNVILHNPASELELPRMEKRLPQEALSLAEAEKLMAIPDVTDPLGVRDRVGRREHHLALRRAR